MRSLRSRLVYAILTAFLASTVAGCGGNSSLEKIPEQTKQPNLETDMPGYKEQKEKERRR